MQGDMTEVVIISEVPSLLFNIFLFLNSGLWKEVIGIESASKV